MLLTVLLLAATPLEAAQARLEKGLKAELDRRSLTLVAGPNELTLRLTEDAFDRMDPIWKSLYAIDQESRRPDAPHFRIEAQVPPKVCQHRVELIRGYLFKKQRADPRRITVRPTCG